MNAINRILSVPSLKKNFPYFVQSTQVHGDIHKYSEKEASFARSNSLKYRQNSPFYNVHTLKI